MERASRHRRGHGERVGRGAVLVRVPCRHDGRARLDRRRAAGRAADAGRGLGRCPRTISPTTGSRTSRRSTTRRRCREELLKTVDWVSRYTLAPPGLVLRSRAALDRGAGARAAGHRVPPHRRTSPTQLTPARPRVLDVRRRMARPGPRRPLSAPAGVSTSVIEGLERAGALERIEMPAAADRRCRPTRMPRSPTLTADQAQALARSGHCRSTGSAWRCSMASPAAARPRCSSRRWPTPCGPGGRRWSCCPRSR